MPIWAIRPEQGQSDAHRTTEEIHRRTCGFNLTSYGLSASQGKAEHKQVQTAQAVSWLFCCLQNQPHKNSMLIKREGHSSQPEPEPSIHRCLLISPKCLSTVEVQNAQASICPGPPFCIIAGAEQALCSSSPQGPLGCLLQRFRLWQASPLSLSLCPYQCSTAGPGARPHSLNYRLRRTQCSLLCADRDTFMARVQS